MNINIPRTLSQGRQGEKIDSSMNLNFKSPMASTHGSPFHQINIEHLIERERQKLIDKANRQKQITLLKFSEERDRKEFL
jgi:hypothetical protein